MRLLHWGFIKYSVYVLPRANDWPEYIYRIEEVITFITLDFLTEVWEEFEFWWGVCRGTKCELNKRKKN